MKGEGRVTCTPWYDRGGKVAGMSSHYNGGEGHRLRFGLKGGMVSGTFLYDRGWSQVGLCLENVYCGFPFVSVSFPRQY